MPAGSSGVGLKMRNHGGERGRPYPRKSGSWEPHLLDQADKCIVVEGKRPGMWCCLVLEQYVVWGGVFSMELPLLRAFSQPVDQVHDMSLQLDQQLLAGSGGICWGEGATDTRRSRPWGRSVAFCWRMAGSSAPFSLSSCSRCAASKDWTRWKCLVRMGTGLED